MLAYSTIRTPRENPTLDLQVIDPAFNKFLNSSQRLENMHTSVVGGLRTYSRF